MARRKVLLPKWKVSEELSTNKEALGASFEELSQGELVINTTSGYTSLVTYNEFDIPVVFESAEMIDRRLKNVVDGVHTHDNKAVLDSITSGRVESWDNAEVNAINSAQTYVDKQIEFLINGATIAFDTLKEVEDWINSHSGKTISIIEDINSLNGNVTALTQYVLDNERVISEALNQLNESAGFDINGKSILPGEMDLTTAILAISGVVVSLKNISHTHNNKNVLDGITSAKVTQWDAAEPNVITEISAITKDNSNVISVNGKKVTIDLTNVGDENVIETVKVNNSALTIVDKTVNVDLSYLEKMIEDIELTPGPAGPSGAPGANAYISAVTASIGDVNGNPSVKVTTGGTPSNISFNLEFNGIKGDKGDSLTIKASKEACVNINDCYIDENGHLQIIAGKNADNSFIWTDAGEIKGPKGDQGEQGLKGDQGEQGPQGVGIVNIERTTGNGSEGTTDIYTITYSNSATSTFNVYNGKDGKDGIDGQNGKDGIDGQNGKDGQDGKDGENGITPEFTSITATLNNTSGTPSVSVASAKTEGEKYTLEFNFQNIKGDKGDKGEDGTSVKILGTKNSDTELPLRDNDNGDGYIIGENLWVWNGNTWENVGKIRGPQGDPGTNAYISAVTASIGSATGDLSVKVTTGGTPSNISFNLEFNGIKGDSGDRGPQGDSGAKGDIGYGYFSTTSSENLSTTSTTISKSYVNNSGSVRTNDYIVSKEGEVFRVTGASSTGFNLTYVSSFRGPQGAPGADGTDGTDGSRGDIGYGYFSTTPYENISSASTSINKSYVNNSGSVRVNDYIVSREGEVFRVTGSTTNGFNIAYVSSFRGPQGAPGYDGTDGTDGSQGDIGYGYFSTTSNENLSTTSTSINKSYVNYSGGVRTNDYIVSREGEVFRVTGSSSNYFNITYVSSFRGPQGESGADGTDGSQGDIGYGYFSTTSSENLSTTSTSINKSYVNNSGSVRTNDYIVSKEGEVFRVTGSTGSYFYIDYVSSFKGPQGAPGSNGSNGEDGGQGERGNGFFLSTGTANSSTTYIYKNQTINGGDVTENDLIISSNGNMFVVTGATVLGFDVQYVSSLKGPQGATGTFDSSVLNNYVQTGDTNYLNEDTFTEIRYGQDALLNRIYASDHKSAFFMGRYGIHLTSGATVNQINIDAPHIKFINVSDGTYKVVGTDDYSIMLDTFFSITANSDFYDSESDAYSSVKLSINTGTSANQIAAGNHDHAGVYLTEEDLENYDFGVSQSRGSSTYYLLGVTNKSATTVTTAYVSSTDVYMQGGEIYAASDETLKNFGKDVEIDFDKLAKIPKVYYTWKTDADKKQQIGTSAQKLREVYPELVSESEDGKLAVSYEKLSIIALTAVDKLHKENEELKDRLKRIEEKLGL